MLRASGVHERGRKFWHFYILKVLFLSTFWRYFKYFVGTNDNYAFGILGAFLHTKSAFFQYFVGTYDNAYGMTLYINNKVLTLWKSMFMRASYKILAFLHTKSAISFNILSVLQIFCRYKWYCLSANMYRQISKCTDKTPKKHYWGGGGGGAPPPPPSGNDSDTDIALFMTSYTDQETRNLRTF